MIINSVIFLGGKYLSFPQWQPTLVPLPGKSHERRSLVGYSPWGHKELDTTERLHFTSLLLITGVTSPLICSSILGTYQPGESIFQVSYLFAFLYCSWGSQGKNTEVVCHSLFQWSTFCQNSPPWSVHIGWSYTTWLSFIESDKAVVHVIRLDSFLWLWFQSVCPPMPSLSAYHLSEVSLTLDMGYFFTAAPVKHSRCSLAWTWGLSSQPPLLMRHWERRPRGDNPRPKDLWHPFISKRL